jgi:hypothetical protein
MTQYSTIEPYFVPFVEHLQNSLGYTLKTDYSNYIDTMCNNDPDYTLAETEFTNKCVKLINPSNRNHDYVFEFMYVIYRNDNLDLDTALKLASKMYWRWL